MGRRAATLAVAVASTLVTQLETPRAWTVSRFTAPIPVFPVSMEFDSRLLDVAADGRIAIVGDPDGPGGDPYGTYILNPDGSRERQVDFVPFSFHSGGWEIGGIAGPIPGTLRWALRNGPEIVEVPIPEGATYVNVMDVNSSGTAILASDTPDPELRVALWSSATGFRPLEPPHGGNQPSAFAINDAGVVAGAYRLNSITKAAIWSPAGVAIDIATLPGSSVAFSITESGIVAGSLGLETGVFRWTWQTGMEEMPDLIEGGDAAYAAINESGQIAASTEIFNPRREQAVRWEVNGTLTPLAPGYPESRARGINEAGAVVGDFSGGAFVWNDEYGLTNLGAPVSVASAREFLPDGSLIGSAQYPDEDTGRRNHVVRWNPIASPVAPSQPRMVAGIDSTATTSARVAFGAPISDGGSELTGYSATVQPGGATYSVRSSATSIALRDLPPGNYRVTVRASNAAGSSEPSEPATITVHSTAFSVERLDNVDATTLSTQSVVSGDFNGDGLSDLLFWGPGSGADRVGLGRRDRSFRFVRVVAPARRTTIPVIGDFDGDGRDDVFWYAEGTQRSALWWGTARLNPFTLGSGPPMGNDRFPKVGDFNGDGTGDIDWHHASAADILWNGTSNRTFRVAKVLDRRRSPGGVAGNFNGDRREDIWWYTEPPFTGKPMWLGSSTGFALGPANRPNDGPFKLVVGDFDGSGIDDVMLLSSTRPDRLWHGTRTGKFLTAGPELVVAIAAKPLVGDFDGNGRDDIYWHAPGSRVDRVWWSE